MCRLPSVEMSAPFCLTSARLPEAVLVLPGRKELASLDCWPPCFSPGPRIAWQCGNWDVRRACHSSFGSLYWPPRTFRTLSVSRPGPRVSRRVSHLPPSLRLFSSCAAVPCACHAWSCLRSFAPAVPWDFNPLPASRSLVPLTQDTAQMSSPQKAFPAPCILKSAHTHCNISLFYIFHFTRLFGGSDCLSTRKNAKCEGRDLVLLSVVSSAPTAETGT